MKPTEEEFRAYVADLTKVVNMCEQIAKRHAWITRLNDANFTPEQMDQLDALLARMTVLEQIF